MNDDLKNRLAKIFEKHASTIQAARHDREARNLEDDRQEASFRIQFEQLCSEVVLPVFEEIRQYVRDYDFGCTIARSTHGEFFSGADETPGIVLTFHADRAAEQEARLGPMSTHVAVFANNAGQNVLVHSRSVTPGGFTPGKIPSPYSVEEITPDLLTRTCLDVIEETLHRMES